MPYAFDDIIDLFGRWEEESHTKYDDAAKKAETSKQILDKKLSEIKLGLYNVGTKLFPDPDLSSSAKNPIEDVLVSLDLLCFQNRIKPEFMSTFVNLTETTKQAAAFAKNWEAAYTSQEYQTKLFNRYSNERHEYEEILESFFDTRNNLAKTLADADSDGLLTSEYLPGDTNTDNNTRAEFISDNLSEIITSHYKTADENNVPSDVLKKIIERYNKFSPTGFDDDYRLYCRIRSSGHTIALEEFSALKKKSTATAQRISEFEENKSKILSPLQIKSTLIKLFSETMLNDTFATGFAKEFPELKDESYTWNLSVYGNMRGYNQSDIEKQNSAFKEWRLHAGFVSHLNTIKNNRSAAEYVTKAFSGILPLSPVIQLKKYTKERCVNTMISLQYEYSKIKTGQIPPLSFRP